MDEYGAIPMDGQPVDYHQDSSDEITPGEYFFRIEAMKRVQQQASGNMPSHVNVKFKLRLETPEGVAGYLWDNIRMYNKFLWKYADLAKAIGHTPPDSTQIRIDWGSFVGSTGKVKITDQEWKKQDGTVSIQKNCKYLVPAKADGSSEEQPF